MDFAKKTKQDLRKNLIDKLTSAMIAGEDTTKIQEQIKILDSELGLNENANRQILRD